MAVRAASWAFLGLFCAAVAAAAERPPAPGAATSESLPVATDARLGGDESQTRFVMDFSRKIELRAFTLADPYRVVIDIPQVIFQLPPKAGDGGRGLIVTVQAADVSIEPNTTDSVQVVKKALRKAIEPVTGDAVSVEHWETVTDDQGNLSWRVWARR